MKVSSIIKTVTIPHGSLIVFYGELNLKSLELPKCLTYYYKNPIEVDYMTCVDC